MDVKTQCIAGIDHKFEYVKTAEGRTVYICWQCGDTRFEFEESHGG